MPTAPSTPIRRWFVASSAPAGAGPRCARAPQTDEGHAINVSKEALARLRQRSAMTQCAWEAMTYQPRVVQQKIIQPTLRYQGADRDQRKVESHLTPLVRLESELVVAVAHIGLAASPLSYGTPIVFVVDEDDSVRESIELLVRSAGWQPETFESARAFLRHPRVLVPSCLVFDVSLPDLNRLELQKSVAADRPDMPIIVITGRSDVAMAVQAMKGGALEFLTKPFADDVLLNAISKALELSKIALDEDAEIRGLRDRYASLSRRERQVMALVVCGLLNKQVGVELGISEITVKAHRGRVMQKMAASSLPALVMMAARLAVLAPKD